MPRRRRRIIIGCLVILFLLALLQFLSLLGLDDSLNDRKEAFFDKAQVIERHGYTDPYPRDQVVRILLWTAYFKDERWGYFNRYSPKHCPAKCMLVHNRSEVMTSDVVLFHPRDLWLEGVMPTNRHSNQIYVLVNLEPPWYVYLDLEKYANVFNWTSFIRSDSDFPSYYYKIVPKSEKERNQVQYDKILSWLKKVKKKGPAWVASNCGSQNGRELYVDELQKYIDIETYGRCGFQNSECPRNNTCTKILETHKFYLAFENSNCKDYVSEKFWRTLSMGTVPVVLGGIGNYEKVAPPGSYINTADFQSPQHLATYLRDVANDFDKYGSYFKWALDYSVKENYWCDLCQALHDWGGERQSYRDLRGWLAQDTCVTWNVIIMYLFYIYVLAIYFFVLL